MTKPQQHRARIMMVAAENGAIPGGKVGGIGDVLRDIPPALANSGCAVDVLTPGYQAFGGLPGAQRSAEITVSFAGAQKRIEIFRLSAQESSEHINLWALEHADFAVGGEGNIYCNDPPGRPFASDARKFALFCQAVAEAIRCELFTTPDILHLHDWHAAPLAVLRAFHPDYQGLQAIRCVYTIHNLALQGVRPLAGDDSSLFAWYPELQAKLEHINDPRAVECFNPMRAAINLCDAVHAVSPSYAEEILHPSNPEQGFVGGEGLEQDLQSAADQKRLHGILNGCEYPGKKQRARPEPSRGELLRLCQNTVMQWLGQRATAASAHVIALSRLTRLQQASEPTSIVLTSIGRLTAQKVRLLQQSPHAGHSALEIILEQLPENGLLIMLGSGDPELEQFLTEVAGRQDRFLFLNGYSDTLADALYLSGDLFLMPSSFEPCGISQMLAMRAGQPCLVHSVGGLKDTVQAGVNGFCFSGENPAEQAGNMLSELQTALSIKRDDPGQWNSIVTAAEQSRFTWEQSARQYLALLYRL